jgi:hypothetical protein
MSCFVDVCWSGEEEEEKSGDPSPALLLFGGLVGGCGLVFFVSVGALSLSLSFFLSFFLSFSFFVASCSAHLLAMADGGDVAHAGGYESTA